MSKRSKYSVILLLFQFFSNNSGKMSMSDKVGKKYLSVEKYCKQRCRFQQRLKLFRLLHEFWLKKTARSSIAAEKVSMTSWLFKATTTAGRNAALEEYRSSNFCQTKVNIYLCNTVQNFALALHDTQKQSKRKYFPLNFVYLDLQKLFY